MTQRAKRTGLRTQRTPPPRLSCRPIHHRRFELVTPRRIENGAAPGVEQRVVLEHDHRALDDVETGNPSRKQGLADAKHLGESRAKVGLEFGSHGGALNRAGAAVNQQNG